ncbi:hypothetical protein VZT92_000940 [Zoarces viviparus]|uniref:G-protein coupled receptors family 2 profile 2 domain-containing protein n=1 Tax=Zoarces viviparus TaxID=48416 RepID=A0AAW1G7A2_ZOAVI
MWISLFPLTLVWLSTTQASEPCQTVFIECQKHVPWTSCYEDKIASCMVKGRLPMLNFIHQRVSWKQEADKSPTPQHRLQISSSALQRSRGASEEEVLLVATVINSTFFKESPRQDGTGSWNTSGCDTSDNGSEFICSCNHLSFFAVLVNPALSVDESDAVNLSYITYVGSALSIFFTVISLIIYICLQRRRPEKAIGVHLQLTGALLCLHLSFLLCCFWVWQLNEKEDDWVCRGLGLLLHWSLLATFTWTALEGFHLYLLLVRVFNIYIRRYLLKLSLVGWGLPTLIAVVCGISGVYGKYSLELRDADNRNSTAEICWMSSHRLSVSFVTTVAFPCLVILCNSCMLGLVVFKLWGLRAGRGGAESGGDSEKMTREKWMKLWKDCATVLGLSCVLGLPWGLASTTYISLSGIYVFTILNSLQGVFMFLWSLALSCKSRSDNNSSVRDPSTQKMMTTSFNN